MKFTGNVYRPPFEAHSLLLQVTQGCSHNQCAFCTMYRGVSYQTETMEQVETDLREASAYAGRVRRVFLENGDAFALDAAALAEVARMIHKYLPLTETIAMYASIRNIRDKADSDLKQLRELGINELNIGVESGLDDALWAMRKGYTAAEAITELKRLRKAGIEFGANVILGIAGSGRQAESANATAALLNETRPYLIFTGTLHADPGCPLYDVIKAGAFAECSFGEYLNEEELLLEQLDLDGCQLFSLHPSNVVRMRGTLNRDKEEMLSEIRRVRAERAGCLDERPIRAGEGAIIN